MTMEPLGDVPDISKTVEIETETVTVSLKKA